MQLGKIASTDQSVGIAMTLQRHVRHCEERSSLAQHFNFPEKLSIFYKQRQIKKPLKNQELLVKGGICILSGYKVIYLHNVFSVAYHQFFVTLVKCFKQTHLFGIQNTY
jgi:hypothetical protein